MRKKVGVYCAEEGNNEQEFRLGECGAGRIVLLSCDVMLVVAGSVRCVEAKGLGEGRFPLSGT